MANAGVSGFDPMVLTSALVCWVQPGLIYSGGATGFVQTTATQITCAASTTTYIYFNGANNANAVQSNTTGFPPDSYPIAIVTTNASIITGIQDVRTPLSDITNGATFFTTAPVTLQTCNSTVQNIISYTLPPGLLNAVGKVIRFKAAGNIVNVNTAGGLQVGLTLGSVNCVLVNSANLTSAATPFWQTELTLMVANAGVNGNIEGHGYLGAQLTASGAAVALTVTPDQTSAVSSNINLNSTQTLSFFCITNGAITNFNTRYATLEILN